MAWVNQEGFVVLVCALVLVSSFNYSNRQSHLSQNHLTQGEPSSSTAALPSKCNILPIRTSQSSRKTRRPQPVLSGMDASEMEERRVFEKSISVMDVSRSYTPLVPFSSE